MEVPQICDNEKLQQTIKTTTTTTSRSTAGVNNGDEINTTMSSSSSSSSMMDWARFSQWIHCMCVVTFDLNLGQALEYVYPPEFLPTEQEVSNICYMAFPDSNSGCMGDTKFHMRLRAISSVPEFQTNGSILQLYNGDCGPTLRVDQSHFWGFVYFRQKRDANLPRGYFQKSFIIVTRLPFFNLYYDILGELAPKYFNDGPTAIQAACHQINIQWPALYAGLTLDLPLFECKYQITIAKGSNSSRKSNQLPVELRNDASASSALQQYKHNVNRGGDGSGSEATQNTKIISSVNEIELFHSLSFVVENLYTLWELVLIGEPIVVVGTSPADCSHMVQALVALIAPLEYCAEARPYFTIHDSEFKEFTQECSGKALPAVILGVTNPFFVKLFKDWPHMLRLIDNQMNIQQQQQFFQKNLRNSNSSATSFGTTTTITTTTTTTTTSGSNEVYKMQPMQSSNLTSLTSLNANHSLIGGGSSGDGSLSGLHTKYKSYLKKDKSLIKKVLLGIKTKRPEHVQTALLRRHLLELTQSFMIPLERYMASLMPLQKDISPFKSAPNASSFKLDDFLATLELSGPHLTSPLKGDWKGLYRRFFKSPNFRGWYDSRHRELQLTLQDLQLQALSEANLEHWARDKQEVEIIDMILKLKQKLNLYTDKSRIECGHTIWSNNSTATRDQIRSQIQCMKDLLPHDLKNVVNI